MKIIFVLFLVLLFLFIPIKIVVGSFPNVYHFDFDPTLVQDSTLLRDHPQIKSASEHLIIRNNKIESDIWGNWTSIDFDILKVSNSLDLIIDIEYGFQISNHPMAGIRFYHTDVFGHTHLVLRALITHDTFTTPTKKHIQLKYKNQQWFSRHRFMPHAPTWTNWKLRNTTGINNISHISKTFISSATQIGPPYLKINDIKVFNESEGFPPSFSLNMYPYDKEGITKVRTPNYVIDSILTTDFAIKGELTSLIPPFNKMIDRITLLMVDTKAIGLRTITKYPLNLPYDIYWEPPAPEVPEFIQMQATMKNFRPSTWLLLGYRVHWKCGFYWNFPASKRHFFIVSEEHLTLPPPELIEGPEKIPYIIPPILFPDLPPPEPRPPITEPLNRLIWHIEGFFRMIFFPSQGAINNLNYQVSRLQHRFPINYINETRRFFKNLTYTPTNSHPTALTIAFPVIGQEPIEIEIINFNWLNNPVYVFGTSTTIANLLKSLTSFFIVILFITFIIAIIKVIL